VQAKRKGGLPLVLLVIVLILLISGFVTAYALGYLRIVNPAASVSSNGGLCGSLIADYNKAFETSNGDVYKTTISNAARNAEEIDGNESDPNCVYIRYTNAIISSSKDDATRFANILADLAEQDKYLTGELANPQGIEGILNSAKALSEVVPQDGGGDQSNS